MKLTIHNEQISLVVNLESFLLNLYLSRLPPIYLFRPSLHSFITIILVTLNRTSTLYLIATHKRLANTELTLM